MTLRKSIFWLHLSSGLAAGIIIAIMSVTGIALAFEAEILNWIDRDLRTVSAPTNASRLTLDQLDAALAKQKPGFKTTAIVIPREADRAYEYRAGRAGAVYVDPYTGTVAEPKSKATHDVLHVLEDWHRWLGREGEGRAIGKLITGIANLAFLFMCVTGVYMWWPRSWKPKALRPALWFVSRIKGRARDFNWHNVFGWWSSIVLIVIVVSGAVMSFGWANRLVFTLAGEQAPARGPGAQTGPQVVVPTPAPDQQRLSRDAIAAKVATEFPQWESITFDRGGPNTPVSASASTSAIQALNVIVLNPAAFQNRGRVQLSVDPFRGDVLSKMAFEDRSKGARARVWLRFLHTGEAFGLFGKIIATLATIASLFLVYTGFALSYRRFFMKKPSA